MKCEFNWDFFPHGGENYRNPNRVGKRDKK